MTRPDWLPNNHSMVSATTADLRVTLVLDQAVTWSPSVLVAFDRLLEVVEDARRDGLMPNN